MRAHIVRSRGQVAVHGHTPAVAARMPPAVMLVINLRIGAYRPSAKTEKEREAADEQLNEPHRRVRDTMSHTGQCGGTSVTQDKQRVRK